jgi:hypothetical protein
VYSLKWLQKNKNRPRSVVFFRHSYYHFYYLAKALKKRGWDAITVNLEDPNGPNANYYHGEDINLYSKDPLIFKANIEKFYKQALKRFQLIHFAGDGLLCFLPEYEKDAYPEDILNWRKNGKKIAYTPSGCNSGVAQTTLKSWSALDNGKNVCSKCVWELRPDVCNDADNLSWGNKVKEYCDLIFGENLPALDLIASPEKVIRSSIVASLDPEIWSPNLKIPDKFLISKNPSEIFIYHAVGNYSIRNQNGRNIKGTPAVVAAVERLKDEGLPVRLIFFSDMKNIDIRFMQSQADIIVDQLNYGRYGATAREGMMLGKPVIHYMNMHEMESRFELSWLKECPLVSASEETVYEVLKDLILNPDKRRLIGVKSREYALKWHNADACAERYEVVYDALMSGTLDTLNVAG